MTLLQRLDKLDRQSMTDAEEMTLQAALLVIFTDCETKIDTQNLDFEPNQEGRGHHRRSPEEDHRVPGK